MCFKNLPIEFDSNGKAKLLESAGDPYGTATSPIKNYVRVSESNMSPLATAGSAASTTPPRLGGWATN
jgi:hypothetical protein